jgi:hypothetical protein
MRQAGREADQHRSVDAECVSELVELDQTDRLGRSGRNLLNAGRCQRLTHRAAHAQGGQLGLVTFRRHTGPE